MQRSFYLFAAMIFSAVVLLASVSHATYNVLFILDGSNSMWGQVDGTSKITTAKAVLVDLLKSLPGGTNVGIMAYGHRWEGNCKDVELLVPIGPNNPGELARRIGTIQPKGKTPLTYALDQSLPLFASLKGQNNYVVLVSDGKETCGGDPCQAAKKLAAAGVGVKIHVVGFDVSAAEKGQLECIAKEGKGRYFNAGNTEEFKRAFAQVKREVTQTPLPKKTKVYFFDDLDGDELKEHWEVMNPDQEYYIVEDGHLLIVTQKGLAGWDKVPNMMVLTKALPKGDWVATLKVRAVMQTLHTPVYFLLYQDKGTYLGIISGTESWMEYRSMYAVKRLKGKNTRLGHYSRLYEQVGKRFLNKSYPALYLRIKKTGHKYTMAFSLDVKDWRGKKWRSIGEMTMLRIAGRLVLGTYISDKSVSGETNVEFDWVKIEAVK